MQIGDVSKITGISISTLRYYDRNGLLSVNRTNGGIRVFSKNDLEALRIINCLKNSGMKICEIKQFMDWCLEGDSTIDKRYNMFCEQEENIKNEISKLEDTLKLIRFKKWYYSIALKDGSTSNIKNMDVSMYPDEIKKLYEETH